MELSQDFAAQVAKAAEEMRRKGVSTEIRTETLPPEIRMVIDQLKAVAQDHEKRLTGVEAFRDTLVTEAQNKARAA
jgi:ribosomal 50S subunit-associated protein YjgA (DUF615 family)